MARARIVGLALLVALGTPPTARSADTPVLPDGLEPMPSRVERDTDPKLTDAERARFANDNQRFAFDLYAALAKARTPADNLFFSPYSISLALAPAYAGAEGDTEREIARVLHFGLPEPALHRAFNATARALASRAREVPLEGGGDGLQLRISGAAFAQRGFAFRDDYLDTLARHYGTALYVADFAREPGRARAAINTWVAEQTEKRIEQLLPEGAIDESTRLVLANAVHFKGAWQQPFRAEDTKPAAFHASSGDVPVQMMHASATQGYAQGDGYRALELLYASPAVRMLLVLPDAGRFAQIESGLTADFVKRVREALRLHDVQIALPRFSYRAEADLGAALGSLGMESAFTAGAADFSGMDGTKDLHIDDAVHQAFVAVDEAGTTASAATAVMVVPTSVAPPAQIAFDRPFLYLIYDEPTGQVLFLGRLAAPE